ncbi:MAG: hypothetical protein U9N85_04070 [Bacteroidota bacterium]|nr:hypothetical protein [Bacteroidota bacterium]
MLIVLVATILFLLPYTREVENYSANDVQWELFHENERYKSFDKAHFKFMEKFTVSDKLYELSGKDISIKGFLHIDKIGKDSIFLLTENRLEVCAFCSHDELANLIVLNIDKENHPAKFGIAEDDFIVVTGEFLVKEEVHMPPFRIQKITNFKKIEN